MKINRQLNADKKQKHLLSLNILCFGMSLGSDDSLHVTSPTEFGCNQSAGSLEQALTNFGT